MARAIYEIKLKENLFPAVSEADALEMQRNGACNGLSEDEVEVNLIVAEEHAIKMFMLAKTMYDTDKFNYKEVRAAVRAVALELGYLSTCDQVADCVVIWTERVGEYIPTEEFQEWLLG